MFSFVTGGLTLLFGFLFVVSLVINSGPKMAEINDVFVHVNPGIKDNPKEPNDPFAVIYMVSEIVDGKAHMQGYTIKLNGKSYKYDYWGNAYGLGKYDKKLRKGK